MGIKLLEGDIIMIMVIVVNCYANDYNGNAGALRGITTLFSPVRNP